MAEAIGIASGMIALSAFAFESTTKLCQLLSDFQYHGRNVQQLKDELSALIAVLANLQEIVSINLVDLAFLTLPLLHCGKACEGFAFVIAKCSSRTKDSRTSFRDRFQLRWMGKDVAGFATLLAGYKATITIALSDANM